MNKGALRNADGSLVTVPQMAEDSNLGVSTVRKIALESGSMIRIGRCTRIDKEKFLTYLRDVYTVTQ